MESGNIKLQKFTPISYGDLLPRKIKGEEERKGMRGLGKRERERERERREGGATQMVSTF